MKNKISFHQWVSFITCLSIALILSSKKTYAIAAGMLALTALIYLTYEIIKNSKNIVNKELLKSGFGNISSIFLLSTCSSIIFYFHHNEIIRYFDKPFKLLLFILVLLMLIRFPLKLKSLIIATSVSSIISFGVALHDVYFMQQRAFFVMNAIQGGDIAMSLGLFNAMFCFYLAKINDKKLLAMTLISATMGISASLLSTSRGALLCLPFLMIVLLFIYQKKLLSSKGILFSAIIVGFFILLLSFNPKLTNRFVVAKDEIRMYYDNTNKETSVGYRLELWKSAILSWQEKPFLGWGSKNITAAQKQQAKENKIIPSLYKLKYHAHNQFLEELSVRGILGFLIFIGLLFVPFVTFSKYRKDNNQETRILSYLGMMHLFLISTYCLTQAFFSHNSGMLFYALMTVVLYSTLYGTKYKNSTTQEHTKKSFMVTND